MFRDHGLKSFVDDTNNPTSESMLWSQVRTKVLDKGVVYCFMLKFCSTLMGGQMLAHHWGNDNPQGLFSVNSNVYSVLCIF